MWYTYECEYANKIKKIKHLICHDHDLAIAQTFKGIWVTVVLLVLKAKDLDDVVDFSIFHNLRKNDIIGISSFSFSFSLLLKHKVDEARCDFMTEHRVSFTHRAAAVIWHHLKPEEEWEKIGVWINLFVGGFPDVEHFSSEGEHTITIPSYHPQPRHSERLGRVSLSEDQCAANRVLPTCQKT